MARRSLIRTARDSHRAAILGREQLLPGWEEGILLMKTGGKIQMLLPPELAFGEEGYGMIPANSQIILEVELISVESTPAPNGRR